MRRSRERVPALLLSVWLCGCPGGAPAPDAGPPDLDWRVILADLDGAVLSFWGTSATDLFAVGGTLSPTAAAEIILHHDGQRWARMEVDTGTLWWVFGFAHDDVWAVGDAGTAIHFDGGAWTTVETGADYTLYGIWGAAPDDLWAVGGSPLGTTPGALRHWDGAAWSDAPGVDTAGALFFKVWGTSASDVWVVGDHGALLHYDGAVWTWLPAPVTTRLLTVIGRAPDDVYAVGGVVTSSLVHGDGTTFVEVATPELHQGLMGVWTRPGQPVVVTGFGGLVAVGDLDGFRVQRNVTTRDLHAAWSDGQGTWLAGGGNLFVPTPPAGTIIGAGPGLAAGPIVPWIAP